MTVRTAIRSIRKKGLKKYLSDYRKKKAEENRLASVRPGIEARLDEYIAIAEKTAAASADMTPEEILDALTPAASYIADNYRDAKKLDPDKTERLFELMRVPEADKDYNGFLKARYIKELYPKVYAELASGPVEDKVIVMESGRSPSPSSKYLAKEIEAQGRYRVVYMGMLIRTVPNAVFFENGLRMIKELATAKAMFLSTANELLSHFDVRSETRIIQLWHGVGAFKHVGHSTVNNTHFGKSQEQWDEYDSYRNYFAVTTAAAGQQWIFEESMHLRPEQILPVGVSRTDVFFDEGFKRNALEKLYAKFPQIRGKKIILYAPTFRGVVKEAKAPDRLDVRALADSLKEDYVLLIKHHGLSREIPPVPEDLENSFVFDMNKNKLLDIEQLLVIADICISDYSSVAFEFAITERPIIFFVYDLEDYIEQRGLYFDFEKDAPGPLCRDTKSIADCILNPETSFDRKKLLDFKREYVEACDGHATERTIALIES